MELRFYIDAESGEPHIYKHEVSEREAEDVLRRPIEDRAAATVLEWQSAKPGRAGICESSMYRIPSHG